MSSNGQWHPPAYTWHELPEAIESSAARRALGRPGARCQECGRMMFAISEARARELKSERPKARRLREQTLEHAAAGPPGDRARLIEPTPGSR